MENATSKASGGIPRQEKGQVGGQDKIQDKEAEESLAGNKTTRRKCFEELNSCVFVAHKGISINVNHINVSKSVRNLPE